MIEYYRQKKRARNYFKAKMIEQRNMERLHNNFMCLLHLMIPSTSLHAKHSSKRRRVCIGSASRSYT
ncbi:unnamed protein product, partial [Musa hybrid cultivar]